MADPDILNGLAQTWTGQLAIFVGGVIATAFAVWSGRRNPTDGSGEKSPSPSQQPFGGEVRYFFDGPVARGLEFLQGIYRNSVELRQEFQRAKDEIRTDVAGVRADLNEMIEMQRDRQGYSRRRRKRV